jgi:twitching motility protein PilU
MTKSTELGMQTFDQGLYRLYSAGEISYDAALTHADSANDLRLMIKLGADAAGQEALSAAGNLTLEDTEQAFNYRR